MSWIKEIDEDEAEGELKDIYDEIAGARGKLSNIMKVHSLNPQAMKAHMDLYLSIMFKSSSLNRKQCEMIGVTVSKTNGCEYCVNHHAEALNHYWRDDERIEEFIDDHSRAGLDDDEEAMLDYVIKLTKTPAEMSEEDIEKLRGYGFGDDDILNIDLVASYFNFVNRIALGLGVEFLPEEVKGYDY